MSQRVGPSFWTARRVLVTGHTGFKGSWLVHMLNSLGAQVGGLALPPESPSSLYSVSGVRELLAWESFTDIRDEIAVKHQVQSFAPSLVLHLAAEALVPQSYRAPTSTFATNVIGTANVLESTRHCDSVQTVVVVTSDKVYHNLEWPYPYRESDRLMGSDPYSASKAAAELVVHSYHKSFLREAGIGVATARAGNVIGGGDWSPGRLIPDAFRALSSGEALVLRNPNATRPWQHVLDCLAGYVLLAEHMNANPLSLNSEAWNFGPSTEESISAEGVIEMLNGRLGHRLTVQRSEKPEFHETQSLQLDSSLARQAIGWRPVMDVHDAIDLTVTWYLDHLNGADMAHVTEQQVGAFLHQAAAS
jgi:CDP-glucose 4,6-dehydratase